MDLIKGIETRRSYRGFKSDPVPRKKIEAILDVAKKSPSYTNTQPWEVVVVTGKKKDELGKILFDMAKSGAAPNADLPLPAVWPPELDKRAKEHGARRYEAMGVARDDKVKREELRLLNYTSFGAPCALFLFVEKGLTQWSIFDMGLFTQTVMLAAHASGLATCPQASLVHYPDAVRKFLGIPDTKQLVIGIALGYPDEKSPLNIYRSLRTGLNDFVKWYE